MPRMQRTCQEWNPGKGNLHKKKIFSDAKFGDDPTGELLNSETYEVGRERRPQNFHQSELINIISPINYIFATAALNPPF